MIPTRVCDWIAQRLHSLGVKRVYGITGGGAAGLNDGIAKHGAIQWIGNHHEQASAFAAIGEAKLTGRLSVVMPTTGCGGTNCITGVLDAWQDSVPVLFISGNVNRAQMTTARNAGGARIRKHGAQEADILALVRPLTKYARVVNEPADIVGALEEAITIATTGRKGPVWLDIPTDVQTALIEVPEEPQVRMGDTAAVTWFRNALAAQDQVCAMLAAARRPLVLIGAGARDSIDDVRLFVDALNLPFVCTFGAVDMLPDHPLNIGRIGIKGTRAGNFATSTCDLLIVLGSSLTTTMTGYNLDHFAPHAKVIVADIEDPANQCADLADLYVRTEVDMFVAALLGRAERGPRDAWVTLCQSWRERWPVVLPEYSTQPDGGINLYTFTDALNRALPDRAAVVTDAGSAFYVLCQALQLRAGQRHIVSLAQADMGWALPASIGVALEGVPTVVVTGDGSFQTNLQELATIRAHNLPVKIIVWANNGYLSIRATQRKLFDGRIMGTDREHGLWFPPLCAIADAYDMAYHPMWEPRQLARLHDILREPGAALIEVLTPMDQPIVPTIRAERAADGSIHACELHDMAPALPPDEIQRELAAALALT